MRVWFCTDAAKDQDIYNYTMQRLVRQKVIMFSPSADIMLCLVLLVTKRDRWESPTQGREMCDHYKLSVRMYTPGSSDFTTEE